MTLRDKSNDHFFGITGIASTCVCGAPEHPGHYVTPQRSRDSRAKLKKKNTDRNATFYLSGEARWKREIESCPIPWLPISVGWREVRAKNKSHMACHNDLLPESGIIPASLQLLISYPKWTTCKVQEGCTSFKDKTKKATSTGSVQK